MPLAAMTGLERRRVPTRTLRSAWMGRRALAGELTAESLSREGGCDKRMWLGRSRGAEQIQQSSAILDRICGCRGRIDGFVANRHPQGGAVGYNNKIDVSYTESYARRVSGETYGVSSASYTVNAGCMGAGAGLGNWGAAAEIFGFLRGAEPSVLSVIIDRKCLGRSVVSAWA